MQQIKTSWSLDDISLHDSDDNDSDDDVVMMANHDDENNHDHNDDNDYVHVCIRYICSC